MSQASIGIATCSAIKQRMSYKEIWMCTLLSGLKFLDGDRGVMTKLGGAHLIQLIWMIDIIEEVKQASVPTKQMILTSCSLVTVLNKLFATLNSSMNSL